MKTSFLVVLCAMAAASGTASGQDDFLGDKKSDVNAILRNLENHPSKGSTREEEARRFHEYGVPRADRRTEKWDPCVRFNGEQAVLMIKIADHVEKVWVEPVVDADGRRLAARAAPRPYEPYCKISLGGGDLATMDVDKLRLLRKAVVISKANGYSVLSDARWDQLESLNSPERFKLLGVEAPKNPPWGAIGPNSTHDPLSLKLGPDARTLGSLSETELDDLLSKGK